MLGSHRIATLVLALSVLSALVFVVPSAPMTEAADHGDAPFVSNDQGADLADTYAFLDPTDNTRVILAMTVRGFIAAGENRNFGAFDANIRYRLEIETTGDARPERFIDFTFSKRTGATAPQVATITLMDGQTFTANTTPPSTCLAGAAGCPPAPTITTLGATGIRFFAGMRDDSFNFDIPAFGNFVACVTGNVPPGETCPTPVTNIFARGRDSFAGYNIMNIALSIPRSLFGTPTNDVIGVQSLTQRRSPTLFAGSPDAVAADGTATGHGRWQTIDRAGNPGINAVIMPFARKEEYNAATPQDDANGRFAGSIVGVLTALGTNATNINILAGVVVAHGDLLRLNLNVPNSSLGAGEEIYSTVGYSGFPNGRRPGDDVVDTLLFFVANQPPGGLSDNANVNEVPFGAAFPFFPPPHQPRTAAAGAEDHTRN